MKLDQCLFGYEDGHRLLASSIPLGDEASSLTEVSDLAPGTVFGQSDGYWTGVPAPRIGRYALLRTWPAPEMSRPGCVWTHALLLEPSVLGDVPDLAILMAFASRPSGLSDRSRYRDSLTFDSRAVEAAISSRPVEDRIVRDLLTALYAATVRAVRVGVPAPGQADPAVFAVWSQQWPRLRRNLRFQTAATRVPRSSSVTRLDVALQLEAADRSVDGSSGGGWIKAAAADVAGGPGGALRLFLRRYGQDVRRQRASFQPLVEVKLLHDGLEEDAGPRLLKLVTGSFPIREDAASLKQDVVDGVLVPRAQLEVLWDVITHGGASVFPPPTDAGMARLALLWPERSQDLLQLAESTAHAADPLGTSVFDIVTGSVPLEKFWTLTASYPRVRERMVAARPDLMVSNGVLALDNVALASLLGLVSTEAQVAGELISILLSRDDNKLAEVAMGRFPQIVASQVVAAADRDTVTVSRAWMRSVIRRPAVLLDPVVMGQITRKSLLYDLAEALGWLTPEVAAAGTEPWIAALVNIANDLSDDRRDTLHAFLVALALASGGDGGRRVLEKLFNDVHDQLLKSRLPWRAREILSPFLPDLGWAGGWDFGLRLRLAVAAAYVLNGYAPESYGALARGLKARTMLADAAAEVPGGKPFARAAAGS